MAKQSNFSDDDRPLIFRTKWPIIHDSPTSQRKLKMPIFDGFSLPVTAVSRQFYVSFVDDHAGTGQEASAPVSRLFPLARCKGEDRGGLDRTSGS